jgi:hypothetical protein
VGADCYLGDLPVTDEEILADAKLQAAKSVRTMEIYWADQGLDPPENPSWRNVAIFFRGRKFSFTEEGEPYFEGH